MAEPKNHTVREFLNAVKPKLEKLAADLQDMRARELKKHGKPCEVCAEANCEHKLQKNAVQGYPESTPGSGLPSNTGLGSTGGGGASQPMGMGEKKLGKAEMCKACGMEHMPGEHKVKKDYGGLSDQSTLSKKAPPGEEKLVHKLKDEYGHDEEGKRKAFATAWAVKNGTVNHKGEAPMAKHMPSSSAAALAPAAPKPATPVGQVNAEMGGFKSLAHSPTAMPHASLGTPLTSPMGRKPIAQMGRKPAAPGGGFAMTAGGASTPRASVSGTIPNAKAEKNYGSASKYGTGGPGHATQANMPSNMKASMATTKAEKEMKRVMPAPEKDVPGAKMPKKGESVDAAKTGAGGQIKGNPLRKDAMAAQRAPEGAGVSGKQPVGMGGGDAHKVAGGAKLPKPSVAPGKTKAVPAGPPASEDVDVSEFNAGPAKPSEKFGALKAAGRAEVSRVMTANHEAGKNPNAPAGGGLRAAGAAEAQRLGAPGQAATDAANLKQDLRAGGVGWLRNLLSRLNPAPTAAEMGMRQQGSTSSARFHGALPLQRAESPLAQLGACILCHGAEHVGPCK